MSRILSGVQPTGQLHLGNYLGAIKHWTNLQHEHESLFCIVDLHAITVQQNPAELRTSTLNTAAAYIACGIDPEKAFIFHQSAISGHAELAWILGCMTPLGWLNRMTQFKEKAGKHKDKSGLGLYSYPVLMAADILLYQATHVPVGDDQKQHLELTRDIAGAFNRQYGIDHFVLPDPLILGKATRVMSLRDGTKKMSKSDPSDQSRINLTDTPDEIYKKIKKAKSDAEPIISYDVEGRPEASNLLTIFSAVSGKTIEELVTQYENAGFAVFKEELATCLADHMAPIYETYHKLTTQTDYLNALLDQGVDRAQEIAGQNLEKVKELVGFLDTKA